jgi:hypothetical protein
VSSANRQFSEFISAAATTAGIAIAATFTGKSTTDITEAAAIAGIVHNSKDEIGQEALNGKGRAKSVKKVK